MTTEIHFVQSGDAPVLRGSGAGILACACGNGLIEGFQAAQFLGVGIQCGRCGTVAVTPPLADGRMPPASLIVAEPSLEPRVGAMTVPPGVGLVGLTEMERLGRLLQPVTPADTPYHISPDLLDRVVAAFERHVGHALPVVAADAADAFAGNAFAGDAFAGLGDHALSWSVQHLRGRMRDGSWACMESAPTANAVTHISGFLNFVATWSHHPLFPVMVATAGDRGFSLHGLALFAAAHSLAMMGNRIGFQKPLSYPGRIEGFDLATGATDVARVQMDVFDRFEFPYGRAWDQASLRAAVSDVVAGVQGRINLRNPGLLLLSPGTVLGGFDEALVEAVKVAVEAVGRKNRGLMAVAPVLLRLQPLPDPHAVRFGYGLVPVSNRHYSGNGRMQGGL